MAVQDVERLRLHPYSPSRRNGNNKRNRSINRKNSGKGTSGIGKCGGARRALKPAVQVARAQSYHGSNVLQGHAPLVVVSASLGVKRACYQA